MAKLPEFTSKNFENEVLNSDQPVLVDFSATWCGPCKQLAPIVQDYASDNASTMKVGKIDIDQAQDIAMRYMVMSVPTLMLFKNGKPVEKTSGFMPKKKLAKAFDKHLG